MDYLCVKQHSLNLCISSIFSTLGNRSLYELFVCDFRLNCRILNVLFCVIIRFSKCDFGYESTDNSTPRFNLDKMNALHRIMRHFKGNDVTA